MQTEVFGREGGLTGGMVGSWLVGSTLVGGTIAGLATRGKMGAAVKAAETAVQISPKLASRIASAKTHLGALNRKENLKLLKPNERSRLARITEKAIEKNKIVSDDRAWLHLLRKDVAVRQRRQLKPSVSAKTPAKSTGNPNARVLTDIEGSAVAKLTKNQRLSLAERQTLTDLKKAGKLTQQESRFVDARKRGWMEKQAEVPPTTPTVSSASPKTSTPKATAQPQAPPAPSVSVNEAMDQLRNVRGSSNLSIKKGDTEAFDKLAQDIVNTAETFPDEAAQYQVMKQLAEKAAKANRATQPDFFQKMYDKMIDLKKITVKGPPSSKIKKK